MSNNFKKGGGGRRLEGGGKGSGFWSPSLTFPFTFATSETTARSCWGWVAGRERPRPSYPTAPLLSKIPGSELGDPPGADRSSLHLVAPGLSFTSAGVKILICAYTAATMTGFPTPPPPKAEELMSTPLQQATETLTPTAVANTAVIAGVITVVFITLFSVLIVIIIYLYKNKGSYFTYEPAEGEASATLQMEGDSVQGKKEEYFI
ncbi:small cell adhesion glycoprotein [Antechinus flavipes]|uniref:small cell adhesion glycoprotein n=1 Tax=Antechinus flavipes TaxID=38775 RepID=UPI002235E604|nr:small cell adhesion glycoprotein [Antechinus flavipes]